MENKKINIRSYNKVWEIENRIYAIQNIVLPVPLKPREVLYFFVIAAVIFILSVVIPGFSHIPSVLRYLVTPFALTQFFLKKKLDGKMPQKYFISWLGYLFTKNQYIERFQAYPQHQGKIRLNWMCSQGRRE
jgi:hypothetical protein